MRVQSSRPLLRNKTQYLEVSSTQGLLPIKHLKQQELIGTIIVTHISSFHIFSWNTQE